MAKQPKVYSVNSEIDAKQIAQTAKGPFTTEQWPKQALDSNASKREEVRSKINYQGVIEDGK